MRYYIRHLPVLIQEIQHVYLRGTDFSVIHGQTATAESVYDCSRISNRAQIIIN